MEKDGEWKERTKRSALFIYLFIACIQHEGNWCAFKSTYRNICSNNCNNNNTYRIERVYKRKQIVYTQSVSAFICTCTPYKKGAGPFRKIARIQQIEMNMIEKDRTCVCVCTRDDFACDNND